MVVLPPVPLDVGPSAMPAAGAPPAVTPVIEVPPSVLLDTPWRWAPETPSFPERESPRPGATSTPQARGPDEPSTA